jgi:hypothetical protein
MDPGNACTTQLMSYINTAKTEDDFPALPDISRHHDRFLSLQNVLVESTFCEIQPLEPQLQNDVPYRRTRPSLGPALKPSNHQPSCLPDKSPNNSSNIRTSAHVRVLDGIDTLFQPHALINLNFSVDADKASSTSQCHILLDRGGKH